MKVLFQSVFLFLVATTLPRAALAQVETFDESTDRSEFARRLTIQTSVDGSKWSSKRAVYPVEGQEVALRVKVSKPDQVRWYLVFADITRNYQNANHPWEENPYEWTGVDEIAYHRIELKGHRGKTEIRPLAGGDLMEPVRKWFLKNGASKERVSFYHGDVGTFWFQVEVEKGGKKLRSYGLDDTDRHGLSKKVLRVSVRDGEGLGGYITSFYNVPGIFGSVLAQSRQHLGADCADVLMSAWARWKKKPLGKNYNVQMLVGKFKNVARIQISGGTPDENLKWGEDIKPGDFIAVHYGETGKKFHHIGALESDTDNDGKLSPGDTILHAGPDPLHKTQLKHGAFNGVVVILRPR